ncbi:flavodoxin family protein [Methanomicrobium antiquum]|uniref:Flavodoxin family protein n=1 Tax=Methanomicrobium antiquum TaxID=487686 RepID=A0AAF0FPQ3_9EURY|nr:flavodoxin family protein [Methanomicrobium antiquum]WFN36329.1 flavodoxin family protein [Methanomicrobium antiquum]
MKVLGISGSIRKNGNTAILVKKIIEYIDSEGCSEFETEYISLSGLNIKPCIGCEKCKESKWCVQKDDWNAVAEKMIECDVLIIGSPTYFYDVNGHSKNFIDRTYSLYHDRKLAGKNAVVISVCADRGCERTLATLEGFVNTHGFSSLGFVSGRGFKEGDILKDEHAIKKCDAIGERILKLLSNTHRDSIKQD